MILEKRPRQRDFGAGAIGKNLPSLIHRAAASILFLSIWACTPPATLEGTHDMLSPERSPEEQLETFQIERGLKVELVAAEPLVQDPVVCTFDEDGRLWVVEMRAYMPDMDGEGERAPAGRITVLEDLDGDGQMDASHVYMDSLVMPRAVAPVKDGVLVVYEEALWMTRDLDGDLRADERILIDPDYAGSTLPEHAGNGLWRGVDNWYYNAKSRFRYRLVGDRWVRDSTEFRGQWGLSHDDEGRLYYNYNWSQLHGDLVPPNYLSRNKNHTPVAGLDVGITLDKRVYPARPTPAVNRGYIPGILDEEQRLREFTAACSPFVYRGTALPERFYGNAFVCEPSGNLIKRNELFSDGPFVAARDPHPGREFLASTDERFRPVHLAQGPDGALYVADMYRGLIQHVAYLTPYLREQTANRDLMLPIHRGRIWRIVPRNWKPQQARKLSSVSSEELVDYLASEDGWYRDIAQRLLVERNDPSVTVKLHSLARTATSKLTRFHALWTLEGMDALTPALLFDRLDDPERLIRSTALRLLEPLAQKHADVRARMEQYLQKKANRAPMDEVIQVAFAAAFVDGASARSILRDVITRYDTSALIRDAVISSLGDVEYAFLESLLQSRDWQTETPSRQIFIEALVSAIVRKGNPAELQSLLARLDVRNFDWQAKALFTGLAIQAIAGENRIIALREQPAILMRDDLDLPQSQLKAIASLFTWPGAPVRPDTLANDIALAGRQKERFALGRKLYLSTCSGCHGTDGAGLNRFAPPLRNSEWVVGNEEQLIRIVIHGLEGPIEVAGKRYAEPDILPVMPGHTTLDDQAVAAILTYIRNEWDNRAPAVEPKTVGQVRVTSSARIMPWSVEELKATQWEQLDNEAKL